MRALRLAVAMGVVLLVPALARAQSLAGVVKDTSGAILPGVTVEAASPALIEKVRSVATDATGYPGSNTCCGNTGRSSAGRNSFSCVLKGSSE